METKRLEGIWNEYAENYDVLNQLRPYQDLFTSVINELLPAFSNPLVLDVACGTGNFSYWLKAGEKSRGYVVTGLDNSDEMLKVAEKKNPEENFLFLKHDLNSKLPFDEDWFFDQVVSINTLYSVENPLEVLAEYSRVIKKGGRLILVNPKKGYENGMIIKKHCLDNGEDGPWLGMNFSEEKGIELLNRVISDERIRGKMMAVAKINREISQQKKFHFLSSADLTQLVCLEGFKILKDEKVYADQAIMIVAEK